MTIPASAAPRPGLLRRSSQWLLIVPSIALGMLLIELFWHLFLAPNTYDWTRYMQSRRIVFLDGREGIFENHEDIFTYLAHNEVRNVTAFFDDRDLTIEDRGFTIEYDYRFRTNNWGLVEDTDIVPERRSLLLLGDSFSEGQGAEPWFRQISPLIEQLGYQPVNGGLLGTGFEQWLKLDRYLAAQQLQTASVVVVFISDDYWRPVWKFSPAAFRCLSALTLCDIGQGYLYRLPPSDELPSWIEKIKTVRTPVVRELWLKARLEALLPATSRVYQLVSQQRHKQPADARPDDEALRSNAAIAGLIRRHGRDNIAFLHLPQKEESGGSEASGLQARRAIAAGGGRVVDGFQLCGLTPADYYLNDDHPNRAGYTKIARCVGKVISQLSAAGR
jgi:hypothetical protein